MMHGIEQLPRRKGREIAAEVPHRGRLCVDRSPVDARGEQAQQELRAAVPVFIVQRVAEIDNRGRQVGRERLLPLADQRARAAAEVAGDGPEILHVMEIS